MQYKTEHFGYEASDLPTSVTGFRHASDGVSDWFPTSGALIWLFDQMCFAALCKQSDEFIQKSKLNKNQ